MRTPIHRRRDDDGLRQINMFRTCSRRELQRLRQRTVIVKVEAGTRLCREGEFGKQSFVISAGEAEVTIGGVPIASVGPGAVVGEMAALDDDRRVASVTARTPMTLLVATPRDFRQLLIEVPPLALGVLTTMSGRLRQADAALAQLPAVRSTG